MCTTAGCPAIPKTVNHGIEAGKAPVFAGAFLFLSCSAGHNFVKTKLFTKECIVKILPVISMAPENYVVEKTLYTLKRK